MFAPQTKAEQESKRLVGFWMRSSQEVTVHVCWWWHISYNRMMQMTFIWMLGSDSKYREFHQSTLYHLAAMLETCGPLTMGGRPTAQYATQTPSLITRPLPYDPARFGYTTEGEPPSPLHLSIKVAPSLLLVSFLMAAFSFTGIRNSFSEFCVQHCLNCFTKLMAKSQLVLTCGLWLLRRHWCFW